MKNIRLALALCVVALASVSGSAAAQTCVGGIVRDGGYTLAPTFATARAHDALADERAYGAEAGLNLPGRLAVNGGFAYTRRSPLQNQESIHVRPSLELVRGPASVCLVSGMRLAYSHDRISVVDADGSPLADVRVRSTELLVPVGLGLGAAHDLGPGARVVVYTIPQALFERADQWTSLSTMSHSALRDTWRGIEAGARLRLGPAFAGASWLRTTRDALPTTWTFTAGYAVGR